MFRTLYEFLVFRGNVFSVDVSKITMSIFGKVTVGDDGLNLFSNLERIVTSVNPTLT